MKGIYESIRPMMFAIGLFCAYQGGIVLWLTMTGQSEGTALRVSRIQALFYL
jgi:hypothetical protein